ncbi:MAG: hypothetical protein EZS28_052239 [Streblomastix strix]|uniref:Uncharacterized protein n=1 Tax=Streblomastix strix TaxID=222440 RepID=A0A5J4SGQ6_9EUKA|nr:MAG: hypothetical protein EZS28_052239 [Streblomastix strix]
MSNGGLLPGILNIPYIYQPIDICNYIYCIGVLFIEGPAGYGEKNIGVTGGCITMYPAPGGSYDGKIIGNYGRGQGQGEIVYGMFCVGDEEFGGGGIGGIL